jgi:hypothetical protein
MNQVRISIQNRRSTPTKNFAIPFIDQYLVEE